MLCGAPYTAVIIELPQKFQAVNDVSPLNAGVRLLPFTIPCAIASALTGAFTSGLKTPPVFVILVGGILQTLGLALSYKLPAGLDVPASQYGFEALAGFGVGLSLTTLLGFTPFVVEKSDRGMCPRSAILELTDNPSCCSRRCHPVPCLGRNNWGGRCHQSAKQPCQEQPVLGFAI